MSAAPSSQSASKGGAKGGDWTRRDMTLHESNKYMLEKDDSHDVIFKVKRHRREGEAARPSGEEGAAVESTILPAHMYVLRSRCPALAALVEDERAKQSDQTARGGGRGGQGGQGPAATVVEIDDVTAPALNEVLRYLYYEKKDLNQSNSFDVLIAARKYNLLALEKNCFSYIYDSIDDHTVCPILNRSLEIHDEALTLECKDYISRRTEEVLSNPGFLRATEKVVVCITSMDQLSTKEIDLFTHCVQWARSASAEREGESTRDDVTGTQLRRMLAPILQNIRFPTMTITEFRMQVVPLAILDSYEMVDVYNYRAYTGKTKQDSQFKTTPRGRPGPRERRSYHEPSPRRDAAYQPAWREVDDPQRETPRQRGGVSESPRPREETDVRSQYGPTHSRVLQHHVKEREAGGKGRPTSNGMPSTIYQSVYFSKP